MPCRRRDPWRWVWVGIKRIKRNRGQWPLPQVWQRFEVLCPVGGVTRGDGLGLVFVGGVTRGEGGGIKGIKRIAASGPSHKEGRSHKEGPSHKGFSHRWVFCRCLFYRLDKFRSENMGNNHINACGCSGRYI